MPLQDTGRAIGAVSRLLQERLLAAMTGPGATTPIDDISVGRPEPPTGANPLRRLNVFLYEIEFDAQLRSHALDEGQPPPLWLVLHYLLTPFDATGESDTIAAHEILGEGMRVLQDLNFFSLIGLPGPTVAALSDNPDRLKLTFEVKPFETLSRLMSGSDERYRTSVAFQVRPVPIALGQPPAYSFLVGVDYTRDVVIGEHGIHRSVSPSIGPQVTSVEPPAFDLDETVTVAGIDLHISGLTVLLGAMELGVTSQKPDRLTFAVDPALAREVISGGSWPLIVAQSLGGGRRRKSGVIAARLRPRLDAAVASGLQRVNAGIPTSPVHGRLTLTGELLGRPEDDVFAALSVDGAVVRMFDALTPDTNQPSQTTAFVDIPITDPVPQGTYNLILRVNGEQARRAPRIVLLLP